MHHQTVQRCVERALAYGPMAALDDRPRPGKVPTITTEAKAWLVSLACRQAKDLGYPHKLWTTRLLARHAREHGPAEGHACLGKLVKEKMAEVLCVYREVKLLKESAATSKKKKPSDAVAIISYDEKPASRRWDRNSRRIWWLAAPNETHKPRWCRSFVRLVGRKLFLPMHSIPSPHLPRAKVRAFIDFIVSRLIPSGVLASNHGGVATHTDPVQAL